MHNNSSVPWHYLTTLRRNSFKKLITVFILAKEEE